MKTPNERIKELRLSYSLTLEQLSEIFNNKYNSRLSKSLLSKIENNKKPVTNKLASLYVDYFKIGYDYIFLGKETPKINTFNDLLTITDNSPYWFMNFRDYDSMHKIVDKCNEVIKNKNLSMNLIDINNATFEYVLRLTRQISNETGIDIVIPIEYIKFDFEFSKQLDIAIEQVKIINLTTKLDNLKDVKEISAICNLKLDTIE